MNMKARQDGIGREDTVSLCGPRVIYTGVTLREETLLSCEDVSCVKTGKQQGLKLE